mgnify:CR=1 FL=1
MYIHRFKCNSKELSESIQYFSEIHKSDDTEHLNHYFEKWKLENKELINNEKEYLLRHNYEYDIDEKIFKETDGRFSYWVAIETSKESILDGVVSKISKNEKLQLDYDKKKFEEVFNSEMEKMSKEQ